MNNTPTETKAKGESRRWTYRTEIRSQIDILIHKFTIIINRVNSDPTVERAASFLLDRGASIHQQRLKVLSEPCWIVTHHTALKPNLWWIPGDKVKALDPLPHTLRCSSPRSDAARERLSFKLLLFGSDKSSPFDRFAQVVLSSLTFRVVLV